MTYRSRVTTPGDNQEPSWAPPAEGDDAVESGAIIRSPAETSGENPEPQQTRWPWENTDVSKSVGSTSGVGPTIPTDNLYRKQASNSAGDPTATAVVPPLGAIDPVGVAGVAAVTNPSPATIPPMTAAYAADTSTVDPSTLEARAKPESGLGTWGAFLLVAGITTVVGFVDMTLNRDFTWFTGAAFVIASILGALMVRPRDLWTAVITPPIAFLVALLIAGQPTTIAGSGSLLIREASLVGTGLAFNAPFIFGGTVAALAIVLIRRAIIGKR